MKFSKAFSPVCILTALMLLMNPSTAFGDDPSAMPEAITTRLPNGLQVVLIENHSAPLVSAIAVVKTGSANESYRLNGITHLLEHMLFNGTEKRTQQELYDDADLIGSFNNAFTTEDLTTFIISAPSLNRETALDIQSDMLFHSIFPPDKVTKELGIVEEEIRQFMSSPEFIVDANFSSWAFAGTPYEKRVLGTISGIRKITREDIVDYWSKHYAPNNMTLVVIGDFDPEEMLGLVKKYYGDVPPGDIVSRTGGMLEDVRGGERHIDYVPGAGRSIRMAFDAPSTTDPDSAAYSVLVDLLNDEVNASLRGLLPGVPMWISMYATEYLAGTRLVLMGMIPDGTSEIEAENAILAAISEAAAASTTSEELESAKVTHLADSVTLVENLMSSGFYLATGIGMWGWEHVSEYSDKINAVTADRVDEMRAKYFADPKILTYIVRPFPESEADDQTAEAAWKHEVLPNGLTVIIKKDDSFQSFGLHLLVKNRSLMEPPGKEGIVELLHGCLGIYAQLQGDEGLGDEFAAIGARVKTVNIPNFLYDDYYFEHEYSYIRFNGIDKFWYENIDLLAQLLQSDFVTESILTSSRTKLLGSIRMQANQPGYRAKQLFRAKLLKDSYKSNPLSGTEESLKSISVDDLMEIRKTYFAPDNMILSVVTSSDPEEVYAEIVDLFGSLEASGQTIEAPESVYYSYPGEEFTIDIGGPQSMILYGYPVYDIPEADRIPLEALGLIISKEIAFELRERQGLAYSIGARFNIDENNGYFSISMGTAPSNVDLAKKGIIEVLEGLQTDLFEENDVMIAVNSITGRMIRYRVKRENQAYYIGYDDFHNRCPVKDPLAPWYEITLDDILRVRDKYLTPDEGFFVIAK